MVTTMAAPTVPSGLRRSIWIHTATYQGRVRGGAAAGTVRTRAASGASAGSARGRSAVADARVQIGIGEVDEEVEAHDHGRDDEVHGLHHRVVQARERLEEEKADAGQPEDRLDDHGAADVERHLQAHEADDGDQRVLEGMAKDGRVRGESGGPR